MTTELIEAIDTYTASQLEYAETHVDAGDGYTHIPREGGWDYHNKDQELIDDDAINFKGLDVETVGNLVLDNFEMVPGHMFINMDAKYFVVDSYPVQEIEIDISHIITEYGADQVKEVSNDVEAYINGSLAYLTTDAVWYAVITREAIQELINDNI